MKVMKQEKLKAILEEMNISVYRLAKECKINVSDLYSGVNGRKVIYPKWRKAISEYLNMSEADLFEGLEENDIKKKDKSEKMTNYKKMAKYLAESGIVCEQMPLEKHSWCDEHFDADALQIALIKKYDEVADLLEIVEDQPTAYDVDKVAEEIEVFGGCAECREKGTDKRFYYGMGCKACVYGKIVNIVRRGGAE